MIKEHGSKAAPADRSKLDPLISWHTDHRNFARLLDLIEQQVDAFHAGKSPDYELMHSIVYYLRHYPDCFHHPREDVAFARLVKRDAAMQLTVARRMQEHVVIAAAGENLLKCLERIIVGVVTERSVLEAAAATYLIYYRHHLAAEEKEVIPRAVELLTPADWAAVAAIPLESDPLFGPDFDARYQDLRRQVARAAIEED
jgi:hemerythrin-like domain-containing protein